MRKSSGAYLTQTILLIKVLYFDYIHNLKLNRIHKAFFYLVKNHNANSQHNNAKYGRIY